MNKRKRLVIPVLLGLLCICLFPVTGYAAADTSQSMELTLEVPEKPDARMETSADAKTLAEVALPEGWTWQDPSISIQPGRTMAVTALYGSNYKMTIQVTGALRILEAGTDSRYTIGRDSNASIHCNGVLDALQSVEMDGKTVDPEDYDRKDGSTIITFPKSYLDGLSVGTHTVTLNYEAGSIDSMLEIRKAAGTTRPESNTSGTDTTGTHTTTAGAQTGDAANVAGMAVCLVLSLCGCVILLLKRKDSVPLKKP